jgi:cytochrome c-type biogenesis protein CcmF
MSLVSPIVCLPYYYKISAVWGGHEGSLLLWVLVLSWWSAAVALFSQNLPREMIARVLAIMGMVSVALIAFIVITSNPFNRIYYLIFRWMGQTSIPYYKI